MTDNVAIALTALAFAGPVFIYLISKLGPRFSRAAYPVMGLACLIIAVVFFAFVGWYFVDTGQLVSPGKYRPSTIVDSSAPLSERIFVGAFNLGIGLTLLVVGVGMLRIGRK